MSTTFIVSLFLPKTVRFNLPCPPSVSDIEEEVLPEPVVPKRDPLPRQLSLFQPPKAITPPDTPTEESNIDPFSNEDGTKVGLALAQAGYAPTPAERGSPVWGAARREQIKVRDCSPPPTLLDNNEELTSKARELRRQGITQPKALYRSESHDRIFSKADWRIVNADQGNGGLRNAAEAAAREGTLGRHMWVGTLGMPTDALEGTQQKEDIEDKLATEHDMTTVWCSDKDFDGHYVHYCKQILWPVFHYQIPDGPKSKAYEDHSWKYYVKINQAFADIIVKNWKKGDVIWVHDYHLLLVPGMIRQRLPDAKIGFFLHVAFPSSEIFRCLAVRKELLEGMLGANLIGFQIHEYSRHFRQTCSRLLSAEATSEGLQLEDRFVNVVSFPIGIDPISLNEHRSEERVRSWLEIMREKYRGKKLIVARDKLDHVRGVRQKLLAFELFMNKNPQWRGKVVLIQVALSVGERSDLDATISDIVTRVNSTWANLAYQPVVYLKQDIDYAQYLALLTAADALMITSQREGKNLTSHEFVVCQDGRFFEKQHGSLILSEFTGSSELFDGADLSVNPWDYQNCADAIKTALEMPKEERDRRYTKLHAAVSHHTGSHWFSEFMNQLDVVYEQQHRREQTSVPRLSMNTLSQQYSKSQKRLFVLDYEGTLVNWGPVDRVVAVNPQRTIDVLNELVLDERNVVYVMSGRRTDELELLARRVPRLGLIAENGSFLKHSDTNSWTELFDPAQIKSWKESVKSILKYYLERTPGSEIEDRHCSLVFHWKSADDLESASRAALDCAAHINDSCEEQRVHAMPMDGKVLVEPIDWTKRTAAEVVFNNLTGSADFLMVVGDGRDDEKVFKWANQLGQDKVVKEVVTVSLGKSRSTEAGATLTQGVSGVLLTLQRLAALP